MKTKNRQLFYKDPLSWTLANEGVSSNNDIDLKTLRWELETFVCEGEYKVGLEKMLRSYLDRLGSEQAGSWVSGFYGSGKSHLVKVLRFLWTDFKFPDSSTARSIASLPSEVSDLFKELSTRGKQNGGLHAAGGTLKAGKGDVRSRVLGIIFLSVDLPEDLSVARLLLDLRDDGTLEEVKKKIVASGKDPQSEFKQIYTSKHFLKAYFDTHTHVGDVKEVSKAIQAQYPPNRSELSISEMIGLIRRALAKNGVLPCTVLVLDEVQQFINNDPKITNDVQEVAEAVQKQLDGKILLVCTGQSALSDTPALQKLMGRFTIKTHLKDNDVEKVVRTVVLRKKPEKKQEIEELISKHSGEISRQLKSTKIATRPEDQDAYVQDYPLLPVRRRFWEHVLHSIDVTGSAAQMRTQLRVTHEACRSVADEPIGTVIPADFLYEQIATDLVMTSVMSKPFQELIEQQKKESDGILRSRICSLVFLINKLPRQGVDIGVRANEENLADLLTGDLTTSCTEIRKKVPVLLKELADGGVLMLIDGEYRLQTTEGQSWESEYRRRQTTIRSNESQIASQRAQLLSKAIQTELSGLSVLQGDAKEKRKVTIHHGPEAPSTSEGLTVWVRDGFTENEASVIQDIQKRSTSDPVIHVLVPKAKSDDLKSALSSSLAAEETLNFKGNPTTPEGLDAKSAMQSRLNTEEGKVEFCIQEILRGARVFLSGGTEQPVIALKESVHAACEDSLANLYPKFSVADSGNWATVWKKAKEGNAGALSAVNYQGDPERHPVTSELMRFIGAGKKGSDIYNIYTAPPYGWPKESLDACLGVLLQSGHLAARLNGQPVTLTELDQRKVGQADYRIQHPVLTASQKLRIRKLYQEVGLQFKPGAEEEVAPSFVSTLKNLTDGAGGQPPSPEKPQSPLLTALASQHGNDLLHAIFTEADNLSRFIKTWQELSKRIAKRLPEFQMAQELLHQAESAALPEAPQCKTALDALSSNRSLLDEPDPIDPIRKTLATALRAALNDAHNNYEAARNNEIAKLNANPPWSGLKPEKKVVFLTASGVVALHAPPTGTDAELLEALRNTSLSGYRNQIDAIPTRCQQAFAAAIREASPKAKQVKLPAAEIKNEAELEAWLQEARTTIKKALEDGPAIV